MNPLHAALLGLVEGLTEYLPVSSTGHLILLGHWLGEESEGGKAFEIVIQLGAILAVLVHYRKLLGERLVGVVRAKPEALRLLTALVAGFVPTALAGLALRKTIKAHLFGPAPVAGALVVGGVIMIGVDVWRRRNRNSGPEAPRPSTSTGGARQVDGLDGLEHVTPVRGFLIGLFQCLSLWPGASRSMCTIVGGQLCGLSTGTAAEFSFLLALPTLGAATVYEAYKSRHELAGTGALPLAIGLLVSFLVAWGVIAAFIRYLKSRGLAPFGVYRIALGVLVFWLLLRA